MPRKRVDLSIARWPKNGRFHVATQFNVISEFIRRTVDVRFLPTILLYSPEIRICEGRDWKLRRDLFTVFAIAFSAYIHHICVCQNVVKKIDVTSKICRHLPPAGHTSDTTAILSPWFSSEAAFCRLYTCSSVNDQRLATFVLRALRMTRPRVRIAVMHRSYAAIASQSLLIQP